MTSKFLSCQSKCNLYEIMRRFYAENLAAVKAASSLADGASSRVEFEGDNQVYTLIRESGKSILKQGTPESPELYFRFTHAAVHYITDSPPEEIGTIAKRLIDCLKSTDPSLKVDFKVIAPLGVFHQKGYFKILKLAGVEVPKIFVKHLWIYMKSKGRRWKE